MNYKKIYENLCKKGKIDRDLEYAENHHIIPRCMNGADDSANLTRLTAREHYLAHWLLAKIYPDNWRIAHAFLWMATESGKNKRTISSRKYNIAKKAMSASCSIRNKEINPMWGESAKKKISENMKGDNNPMRRFPERNHILNGGLTPSMGNAKWYTDGLSSKYFRPGESIPDGWKPGMARFPDRGKWITDGIHNKKLKKGNQMPDGFVFGKTHKRK